MNRILLACLAGALIAAVAPGTGGGTLAAQERGRTERESGPSLPRYVAREVVDLYADNTGAIRAGLVISTFACMFLITFSAAIYGQLKRIEGERAPLAMVFMCSAALLTLEFILPMAIFIPTVSGLLYQQTLGKQPAEAAKK